MSKGIFATTMAWVLSAVLVLTPTTRALADAFDDAASNGQSFGRAQVPDPSELFGKGNGGGYEIFPDSDKPLSVTPQELFGTGPGNASELKALRGDNDAIRDKTVSTQQQLATDPSEYGQAYRVLTDSSQRAHPDMSNDPIWDTSREAMEDIFEGAFSACEVTRKVTADEFTTHLPDYRTCNRVPAITNSCTVTHDYKAGVIEHVSGPLNIQSCGAGCRTVWLGRRGDNYWHGEYYNIHTQRMRVRINNPDAITSAVLAEAWWDDHLQVWVNGTQVWWNHRKSFPPDHDSCNVDVHGHGYPGANLTHYFKNVAPGTVITLKTRVLVCDRGEGYARLRLRFDPSKKVTDDHWEVGDQCQAAIKAMESGHASGSITCTDNPANGGNCYSVGGGTICESDLNPSPMPGVSPLCREATVSADLDFNEGQMSCWTDPQGDRHCPTSSGSTPDTCTALEANPSCRFIESQCIEGASDAKGKCYAYSVRYDCGKDVAVPTANQESTYTCPGEVRCMGNECVTTTAESNDDFARAVAALQAADYMAMDMSCPQDQANNIDVNTCKVFAGEASECKVAVGGVVDCCKKPNSGVSLSQYISLMLTARKAAGMVVGEGGPLHGAWTQLVGPVTDAWGSITQYFGTSLDANSASTGLRMIGLDQLKQQVMNKSAQFMVDTFGADAASMFFSANGGGSLSGAMSGGQITGTVQMSAAASTALSVVMWAYTIYVVAMVLVQIIWKCEKSELELGAKRKLKSAHYIGSYCADEVLGACIEERQSYCTFNSPLSRILQEQIRAQLGIGWGSPEHPNCRGLSVAEINQANWEAINLDEWIAILQTTGHMPSTPAEAMSDYSLGGLTEDNPTLDVEGGPEDGKRQDTLTRNRQRLKYKDDGTKSDAEKKVLERNEARRQALWNDEGGKATDRPPIPEPSPRPSPCVSGNRLFTYTGSMQSFTVPADCRRLHVVAEGGDSGAAANMSGHKGERKTTKLTVVPGAALPIAVGAGGGVDSYWDKARNRPAYVGLAGNDSTVFYADGTVALKAEGAPQAGPVAARASQYWRGQHGWVLIGWGPDPGTPQTPPGPAAVPPPEDPAPACTRGSRTFTYTGGLQTFVVPEGCGHLDVVVKGAGGGGYHNNFINSSSRGGAGARVTGVASVSPGRRLRVLVGQGGRQTKYRQTGNWGLVTTFHVGGGGGRSAILKANGAPIAIAGGGGGGGSAQAGDGGFNGEDANYSNGSPADTPARGGTQRHGGAGGYIKRFGRGKAGSRGAGGDGLKKCYGSRCRYFYYSGHAYGGGGRAFSHAGGGGGYYGGGGGGFAGGAGGSSYIGGLTGANVTTGGGGNGGHGIGNGQHGRVVISWRP